MCVCVCLCVCERERAGSEPAGTIVRVQHPHLFHRQQQPIPRSMGNRNRLYSTVLNKERTSREREALGADIAGVAGSIRFIRSETRVPASQNTN